MPYPAHSGDLMFFHPQLLGLVLDDIKAPRRLSLPALSWTQCIKCTLVVSAGMSTLALKAQSLLIFWHSSSLTKYPPEKSGRLPAWCSCALHHRICHRHISCNFMRRKLFQGLDLLQTSMRDDHNPSSATRQLVQRIATRHSHQI